MMVEISDLIISIDLHAVMVLVLCSCNAELQLLNIFNCANNYLILLCLRSSIGVSNALVLVSPIPTLRLGAYKCDTALVA